MQWRSRNLARCITHNWLDDVSADGLFVMASQYMNLGLTGKDEYEVIKFCEANGIEMSPFRPECKWGYQVWGVVDGKYQLIEEIIDSSD